MLTPNVKYELNKMNSVAKRNALGDQIHNQVGCVVGTYSFARDGGAVGDYSLKDAVTNLPVKLPSGAIITNAWCYAVAAMTSGGSATIDLQLNAANDLLAAEAIAGFTLGAKIQGIPDAATLADSVVLTAERTLTMSVNTAALTAGKLAVVVIFVYPGSF